MLHSQCQLQAPSPVRVQKQKLIVLSMFRVTGRFIRKIMLLFCAASKLEMGLLCARVLSAGQDG